MLFSEVVTSEEVDVLYLQRFGILYDASFLSPGTELKPYGLLMRRGVRK